MTPQQLIQLLSQGQYPVLPGQQYTQQQQPVSDFPIGTLAPNVSQGQALTKALGMLTQPIQQTHQQPSQPLTNIGMMSPTQAQGKALNKALGTNQLLTNNQKQPAFVQHIVKPGDTLWGIAQQYTGNGNNWKKLEGFHSDPRTLQAGTVIHVPASMLANKQNIGPAPSNVASSGRITA